MVSAMGTVWEIVKTIWNAVLDLGGTDEDMRNVLRKKNMAGNLALVILGRAEVVLKKANSGFNSLEFWTTFYKKYFSPTVDFVGLDIPPKPAKENWRLLVSVKGLTNNLVYDVCAKQFPCCKYADDLDKGVSTNERDPKNGSYAIWVRDTVEADEVHRNKSADIVKEAGLKTETLLERMIHELAYFSGTGEHLDVKNWTLCSGSRCSGGDVPNADWDDDEFRVNWNDTGNRVGCLRAREVVS